MEEKRNQKDSQERKESRIERRVKKEKRELLETLVNLFFTHRSSIKDPEGEEADALYVKYRNMWLKECSSFNKRKNKPFMLRGVAFNEEVERILKLEKSTHDKKAQEKINKDFEHWLRRASLRRKYPLRLLLYWIISFGNYEKEKNLWKKFYLNLKPLINGTN